MTRTVGMARARRRSARNWLHPAARQLGGAARRQREDVQLAERFARAALAFGARSGAHAVGDVAQHVEVREQHVALGHEADAAVLDGHVEAAVAIEQRAAVQADAAAARGQRAQDHHQRRRPARAVRPDEQRRAAGSRRIHCRRGSRPRARSERCVRAARTPTRAHLTSLARGHARHRRKLPDPREIRPR